MSDAIRHDVAIVGAGPGGSAAAYYLARQGLDVLLLDKADFPRDKTCGDGLTPRALGVLNDMGILDDVAQAGCRVQGVDIFAPKGHSVTVPIPPKAGLPGYSLIVPRLVLDNAIREQAVASGARFEGPIHVTDVEEDSTRVVVKGERRGRPVSFRARVAIIATGASVKLLLRMGILKQPPPMMLAARAYFEGVTGLTDHIHIRFDGVPLPGYGWIFPLSDSSANVGAGFFPVGPFAHRMPDTPREAFDGFVQSPPLQRMLARARRTGPIKGYPLRVDFAAAPTYGERTLLVGEAAGLVNPLTGEGIDYALETGRLAAGHLGQVFARGDLSRQDLEAYDHMLRQRFQSLFHFCNRMRDLYLNRLLLNRMVSAAARRSDLTMLLTNIVLGNEDAAEGASLRTVLKVIFPLLFSPSPTSLQGSP